jgi:hypothetical protein
VYDDFLPGFTFYFVVLLVVVVVVVVVVVRIAISQIKAFDIAFIYQNDSCQLHLKTPTFPLSQKRTLLWPMSPTLLNF